MYPLPLRPSPRNGAVRRIRAARFVVCADSLVELGKRVIQVDLDGVLPLVADLLCAARIGKGVKLVSDLLGGVSVIRTDAPHANTLLRQIGRYRVTGLVRAAAGRGLDICSDGGRSATRPFLRRSIPSPSHSERVDMIGTAPVALFIPCMTGIQIIVGFQNRLVVPFDSKGCLAMFRHLVHSGSDVNIIA